MPSPDARWTLTDWAQAIHELKVAQDAAILAHWYHGEELATVADVVGDTLRLLQAATALPHQTLVVAATVFVAESVKILYPERRVLVPDPLAGCSLAESCPPELFARLRETYPDALAVVHIQSSAELKALSDIVVTTGTAELVVRTLPEDRLLLFAPDHELGDFLRQRTGRRILSWFGACVVHTSFSSETLQRWRQLYPAAPVLASPQCPPDIRQQATVLGSSQQLLDYVARQRPAQLILASDHGLAFQLRKLLPAESQLLLLPAEDSCHCTHCPYMRLNTLPKLYNCLLTGAPEVQLPDELLRRARPPLERLLQLVPPSGK
ncbi:Quinolinate synthase A [bacterium HR21]|nr:Quinolinate synthase A [bacterium HR21]